MVNTRKLLGIMAERGITQKALANELNRAENTVSAKIRGIKPFDTDEVLKICNILNITDNSEKAEIFLALASQK